MGAARATVARRMRSLRRAFDLRPGEAPAVLAAGAMFFCVLASYFVLRPMRDALVLRRSIDDLPVLFTATFAIMTALAPVWGAVVARWPRRRFVPIVYRFFIVQLVGYFLLLHYRVALDVVTPVFYVWSAVFNLFVVSVFWSLCADVVRTEQGRRLFGPIAAAGTAGALVGPLLTKFLVEHLEVAGLFLVSAALLELGVWCALALDRAARRLHPDGDPAAAEPSAPIGGSPFAGLREVARSRFLSTIALYVLITAWVGTFVYFEQARVAKAAFASDAARTAYFADVELWTNLATLAIQIFLTARIMRALPLGIVLAILPVVQGIGLVALELTPGVLTAAAVTACGRAVTHAINRPARELLFTTVAREDKYKAKNVIDTLVFRAGDWMSSWLKRGLTAWSVPIVPVAIPLAAAWVGVATVLGVMFRRRASS